jgi:hypothetical protein
MGKGSQSNARRAEGRLAALAWTAASLALSVALCFVPLFDLLGYELALAVTPLAAAAAIQLGLRSVARARARMPFSSRETAALRPGRALLRLWAATVLRTLPVLLLPLVVMAFNALRVRNCNPGIGLAWYGVLPVGGAGYGAALGVGLGVAWPGLTTSWRSLAASILVLLGALAWCLLRLYTAPPIFVFDPLFGYFAGSVYDEHVAVPAALLWARAYHAAIAAALLCGTGTLLDGHTLTLRLRGPRHRTGLVSMALIAIGAALAGYRAGPALGCRHTAATIAAALGSGKRTEHFVLHYRGDGPYAPQIGDVATELEFRWNELHAATGLRPPGPVHAYLFGSAAEKQSLMGAGHTYIAKPWRNELYVNHEPFPQGVLGHELAHVFGAAAGDRVLGVARAGLRLDVGLIEGLAEATIWHGGSLTSDEAVRVLELLHRLPSLDAVMSPRFWSLPSQQAYAIAGSFCAFLIERGGMPAFLSLYKAGGARDAYPALFGADFAALESAWRARIAGVEIDAATLERERDRILRPSIFRRPCAHELARLVELARGRAAAGDHAGARMFYAQVCAEEPDDPGHLDEQLVEASRADDVAEARAVARRLLAHPKASAVQRAAAHGVLGDLFARKKDYAAAAAEYTLATQQPAEEATARLYTVERTLAEQLAGEQTPVERAARSLALVTLARAGTSAADEYAHLVQAAAQLPDDPLLAYLAARQLNAHAQYLEGDRLLDRALAGTLPDARFVRESRRVRAEMAFRRRDYAAAAAQFDALTHDGRAAMRAEAATWAARARFFMRPDAAR